MPTTMTGKRCLITGATSGIGRVTALELASEGADLILVARDERKAQALLAELEPRRVAATQTMDVLYADLSSQQQVRDLAREFHKRHDRLDVLINNAGAMFNDRTVSVDGIEQTLALNHLAYFLLTALLCDTLIQSGPARIINVASGAHTGARLDINDLQAERQYSGWRVYCNSKLANILFTRELARRLAGTAVTANCLHPGFVQTGFGRQDNDWRAWLMALTQRLLAIKDTDGAKTTLTLATDSELRAISGEYFDKSRVAKSTKTARDPELARQLWEASITLTDLTARECPRFFKRPVVSYNRLGEVDIDDRIIAWLLAEFKQQEGIDLRTDALAMHRLKEAADKARSELASADTVVIDLPFISADAASAKNLTRTLSRDLLAELQA